jgi:hypothetical protein
MSNEAETETVTTDIDAVARDILGMADELEGDDAPAPEPSKASAEPAEEAEPEDDDKAPAEAESSPGKRVEDDKPDEKRVARLFKSARLKMQEADRHADEVARARREIEEARQQLESERNQYRGQLQVVDEFRRDPMGGLVAAARALGTDPNKLYQTLTERQLSGGAPGPSEVADRFAELERKFDAKLGEVKQTYEQRVQQAQQAQLQSKYRECLSANLDPNVGKHWPNLYRMEPNDYAAQLAGAMEEVQQSNPELLSDTVQFLDLLDKVAGDRYAEMKRREALLGSSSAPEKSGEAAASGGSRETDSRPSGTTSRASRGKPVTNDDQAEGGRSRPLSEQERNALSDDLARRELGL